MKNKFVIALAAVSMFALAGCGESEQKTEQAPATTTEAPASAPAATEAPAPAPAPAATETPATPMNVEDAMKTIKEQAATMTAEQKQLAIDTGRKPAEDAAKAAGQTADQIKAAADAAEKAIKEALGVQ